MSSERDPDPEALQERIDELEAQVDEQQDTLQRMLPGRRAFLAAGAGAAVGAVGMREASNVGEASDGTAVGQIGTSSEPVNVVAHDVTSDSVDTDEELVKNDFTRDKRWANLTLDGTQSVGTTESKLAWTEIDDDYSAWATDTYTVNVPSFGPSDRLLMFCGQILFTGLSADDWVQPVLYQNGSMKAAMNKPTSSSGTGLIVPFIRFNEAIDNDTFGIGARASSSVSADPAESKAYIVRLM